MIWLYAIFAFLGIGVLALGGWALERCEVTDQAERERGVTEIYQIIRGGRR